MCGEANYRASLGALFTESVLYGIYVPVFLATVYVHVYRKTIGQWFIAAAVTMFTLSTGLMMTNFIAYLLVPTPVFRAECSGDECKLCSNIYIYLPSEVIVNVLATMIDGFLWTTLQLVADILLTYRCYIIWHKRRSIIILPVLTVLASSILGYCVQCVTAQLYLILIDLDVSPDTTDMPSRWWYYIGLENKLKWYCWCFLIASNVILTGLIASRIWWLTREIERTLGRKAGVKYRSIIAMMIESGAAICIPMIIAACLSRWAPSYEDIAIEALDQILSMVPALIMLRAGLGIGADETFLSSGLSEIYPHRSAHDVSNLRL